MSKTAARADLRDEILDATDRLLARYGYRKMAMDDLAQEVGIGKGTIYLHFASKEEVVLSHIDRIVERLTERLRVLARSEAAVAIRLRLMLFERVMHRFDSVQHYTQSLDDLLAALRPAFLARRARYFDDEALIFVEVLEEGRKSGVFAFKDSLDAAHALLLATNSLLPYSLSTGELGGREEIEAKTAAIADLLLTGLLRRDGAQTKKRETNRGTR